MAALAKTSIGVGRILKSKLTLPQAGAQILLRSMSSGSNTDADQYNFSSLKVTRPLEFVVQVELNRPDKLNAMNQAFWREIRECFEKLSTDPDCRAVIISGAGRAFTAGLDLGDFASMFSSQSEMDPGRKAFASREIIRKFQDSFTVIEKCPKPVIAAIQSACVGGGVDLTSACDIRYCTKDAYFMIKEVDLGITADVGTLQRFPRVIGNDSLARELAYTARRFQADEAKEMGYVSRIFQDKNAMIEGALETASLIASKSPVAVQGTKVSLVYSRDHSVPDSLEHIATWNQGMLQSEDVVKAAMAGMEKKEATFSKL